MYEVATAPSPEANIAPILLEGLRKHIPATTHGYRCVPQWRRVSDVCAPLAGWRISPPFTSAPPLAAVRSVPVLAYGTNSSRPFGIQVFWVIK